MNTEKITIIAPIKVIPSNNYLLVIKDAKGRFHYFDEEGEYDGWSEDVLEFLKRDMIKSALQ